MRSARYLAWPALTLLALPSCAAFRIAFGPGCGNGALEADADLPEQCDDGNAANGDGCDSNCQLEAVVCGDGILQAGEQCDDGDTDDGDGCDSDCQLEPPDGCGDNVLDEAAGEDCDDGANLPNDGCSVICEFEANKFVDCGDEAGGDGSLGDPFDTLSEALVAAQPGEVVMILPGSPPCTAGSVVAEDVTIQGLADLDGPGERPTLSTGNATALTVTLGATIKIQGLIINSASGNPTIEIQAGATGAKIALLFAEVVNTDAGGNSAAVRCTGGLAELLIDRAKLTGVGGGGLRVEGTCKAVVANTLFVNNGDDNATRGAVSVEDTAQASVFFSTFDNNQPGGSDANAAMNCSDGTTGVLDSSIVSATNRNINDGSVAPIDSDCAVGFSDVVIADNNAIPDADKNIDKDPLFVAAGTDFRLSGASPCRGLANPAPDPIFTPPAGLFAHDLDNNPRPNPAGGASDMGAFEAP
jgi:cysteine-rich repeat protein